MHIYERIWREKLNTEFAVRCQDAGGNKLRTSGNLRKTMILNNMLK